MDVVLAVVGRLKAGPETELCARFLDRARKAGGALGLRGFAVKEVAESRAGRPADRMAQEATALAALLKPGDRVVCLSEHGEMPTSTVFADALSRDAAAAIPRTVFVIGGADGLGQAILTRADRQIAFGRTTWPHQIVRVLLAEQLYRATTIIAGHPYHRGSC